MKIEPFDFEQCNYINESEFQKLSDANDSNYLLKFKINPKFYTFLIKADQISDDPVLVDIDDSVMTVMHLYNQDNPSNCCNENLAGFAHSFIIPDDMKLDEIKLYAKDTILLIVIPRL